MNEALPTVKCCIRLGNPFTGWDEAGTEQGHSCGHVKSTEVNRHPALLSVAVVNAMAKSNWERKSCRFQFLTEAVRAGTRARTMEGIKEGSYSLACSPGHCSLSQVSDCSV